MKMMEEKIQDDEAPEETIEDLDREANSLNMAITQSFRDSRAEIRAKISPTFPTRFSLGIAFVIPGILKWLDYIIVANSGVDLCIRAILILGIILIILCTFELVNYIKLILLALAEKSFKLFTFFDNSQKMSDRSKLSKILANISKSLGLLT
ncbi:MAG: hypothetical protein LBP39_00245, partial [Rickettsiales bacterium]|nr:hypothetical protein [Rickettsiales bacterium]